MEPQRILISGISQGLGYALANTYLAQSWKVYGISRNYPDGLQGNTNLYLKRKKDKFELFLSLKAKETKN